MRYTVWDVDAWRRTTGLALPLTYLSEHVASANSVVLALTRAHHVLDGHARVNQPSIGLTRTVLARALTDVESGISAYTITPEGMAMITLAQQTLASVCAGMVGAPSPVDRQAFAGQLGALIQPAASEVRLLF